MKASCFIFILPQSMSCSIQKMTLRVEFKIAIRKQSLAELCLMHIWREVGCLRNAFKIQTRISLLPQSSSSQQCQTSNKGSESKLKNMKILKDRFGASFVKCLLDISQHIQNAIKLHFQQFISGDYINMTNSNMYLVINTTEGFFFYVNV